MRADLMHDGDFGLPQDMQLCLAARVRLNRNLWPAAGLDPCGAASGQLVGIRRVLIRGSGRPCV